MTFALVGGNLLTTGALQDYAVRGELFGCFWDRRILENGHFHLYLRFSCDFFIIRIVGRGCTRRWSLVFGFGFGFGFEGFGYRFLRGEGDCHFNNANIFWV
jgi:hypothetical protein